MRTVYKYKLETTDVQVIKVPQLAGAKSFKEQLLNIKVQDGSPCLWCLVDTEKENQTIVIRIFGTGKPMPLLSKEDYLGSYMLFKGGLVFHVFLEKEKEIYHE